MNPEKIIGCLYGQLIGDALGTRYEFKKSWTIEKEFKKDMQNGYLPILGGGPFTVHKGQCTDDTELAFALAHSILENKEYDKEKIAKKYIKWYQSKPFDIGYNTQNILHNSQNYNDITRKTNYNSLSNGCLMRCSPLAIYGIFMNNIKLLEICKLDCSMTNPNPNTINAVQVYVIAVKTALNTNNRQLIFNEALKYAKMSLIYTIMRRIRNNDKGFILPDNTIFLTSDTKHIGYFGIAFQMAFYELLYGKSFYNSLINVIKQGGDTDTNACIVGSLLGAFYGINNIPSQWIKDVTIRNIRSQQFPEINQEYTKEIAISLAQLSYKKIEEKNINI